MMGYDVGFLIGFYLAEGNPIYRNYKPYKNTAYSKSAQKRWGITERGKRIVGIQMSCGLEDIKRGNLKRISRYGFKIYSYNNDVCLRLYDRDVVGLIKQYVAGTSSHDKSLTESAFKESKEFLLGVLDGFLAGDGSYDLLNNRYRVNITNNIKLKDNIQRICDLLEYTFHDNGQHITNGYNTLAFVVKKSTPITKFQ